MNRFRPIRMYVAWVQLTLFAVGMECVAQAHTDTSRLNPPQLRALEILNKMDTTSTSRFWPHIKPSLFFPNIRKNILYPGKINQGKNTNFCSYAALTHLLIRYQPDTYTEMILSLYFTGKANLYSKRTIKPSERVRNSAGTLKHTGEMNIHHADQLWF